MILYTSIWNVIVVDSLHSPDALSITNGEFNTSGSLLLYLQFPLCGSETLSFIWWREESQVLQR
jgi:hypothetical protein